MADQPAEHPAAASRSTSDVADLARRLAVRLARRGVRWPSVAAAARAARGVTRLDRTRFATELSIPEDLLQRVEDGEVPPQQVPRSLHRRMRLAVGDLAERPPTPPDPPEPTTT